MLSTENIALEELAKKHKTELGILIGAAYEKKF